MVKLTNFQYSHNAKILILDRRRSEFENIYRKMVSINDDPDLQTLFVHQCGLTCIDITELKGGIKVSHLEKLFPYLEKHIDTRHNQSCRDFPGGRKCSCKSVTRNELKRLLRAKDKGKDGILSIEEFCQFLSELDDGVKEKCENADLVTRFHVINFVVCSQFLYSSTLEAST